MGGKITCSKSQRWVRAKEIGEGAFPSSFCESGTKGGKRNFWRGEFAYTRTRMVLAPPYTEKKRSGRALHALYKNDDCYLQTPSISPLTKIPFGFILTVTEYVRAKFAARELCRRWAWWKHRGWNRSGTARAVFYGSSE